jgi:hypothetical protein
MKYYVMEWDIYTSNFELIKICDTREEAIELSSQPWRYYFIHIDEKYYVDETTNLLPKPTKSVEKHV